MITPPPSDKALKTNATLTHLEIVSFIGFLLPTLSPWSISSAIITLSFLGLVSQFLHRNRRLLRSQCLAELDEGFELRDGRDNLLILRLREATLGFQ